MNNQQRQQVLEQLKSSKHVLVTVSSNPTVDELSASIGLTLAINKMNKHATTVFSGVVPSTIEFLQPEKTIETTTDSLRDFIISLDKSKADKLRYKVEDDVVRIFITPYRTTISGDDLEFSQGDFNVDLVIALGVTKRQDLDKAITAHGRILHDATIVTVTKRQDASDLGAINWQDDQASSFCEMIAGVITELDAKVLDGQMATSLLTGIIAETDRFKNSNTTPVALSLSSQLMQSGANQQLIAEKLDEPEAPPELHVEDNSEEESKKTEKPHGANGELEIDHNDSEIDKIHIDDNGNLNLSNPENMQYENASDGQQGLDPSSLPEELPNYSSEDTYKVPETAQDTTPQEAIGNQDNQQDDQGVVSDDSNKPNDVGNDLFDDLSSQTGGDSESEPTLKQPDSSQTPMMQHEKVITPPSHPGDLPKSDKPFDPNEAMAAAGVLPPSEQPPAPVIEDTPKPIEATETPPAPVVVATEPAPELPKVELEQQQSGNENLPPPPSVEPVSDTLADLEKSVDSPHVANDHSSDEEPNITNHPPELEEAARSIIQDQPEQPINFDAPKVVGPEDRSGSNDKDSNTAPPVPPPMTPQFYDADGNNSNPFNNQNQ